MVLGVSTPMDRIGIFLGGMRCGSTATLDYMRQHPQVCIHRVKDPHFFSGDANWTKGWGHYLEGWAHYDPARHRIAFESSLSLQEDPRVRSMLDKGLPDLIVRIKREANTPIVEANFCALDAVSV